METVLKAEALDPIMPARMVNPTPIPTMASLATLAGKPFFQALVPFKVHLAASKYSSKKDSVIDSLVVKLNEATAVAHRFNNLMQVRLRHYDCLEQFRPSSSLSESHRLC